MGGKTGFRDDVFSSEAGKKRRRHPSLLYPTQGERKNGDTEVPQRGGRKKKREKRSIFFRQTQKGRIKRANKERGPYSLIAKEKKGESNVFTMGRGGGGREILLRGKRKRGCRRHETGGGREKEAERSRRKTGRKRDD